MKEEKEREKEKEKERKREAYQGLYSVNPGYV
jgi:hypothetical protein